MQHEYFQIRDLKIRHHSYDGIREVLNIDDLSIRRGMTFGLVGESGAGKTVLAQTILGLLQCPPGNIESGQIILEGENLLDKSERSMRQYLGSKIAMIFQDPMSSLNPVFTVGYQLIKVIRENQDLNEKDAKQKALDMITTVRLPDAESILDKYPHQLSGGQRQRIIIGMALACGAEFLIADEPTRNLDVTIQAGILKLLNELQDTFDVTVLFIANNLGLVSSFCDEIAILHQTHIIERGPVRRVIENPQNDYTRTLLNAVSLDKQATGQENSSGAVLLSVSDLKKYFPVSTSFGGTKKDLFVKAVDGVDLEVNKGEVLGVVGESGCGKSTLVNTILLLHPPTAGKVIFDGKDIFSLDKISMRKARKDVQIVFQDPYWSLNSRWLVKDVIGEPLKVHKKLRGQEYIREVEQQMEMVGLSKKSIYKYPHEFSGGERQRIAIARALSVNPKLIVLDEPTSSIDVLSQAQILDLMQRLKEELGLTYILISHDLHIVHYMSNEIIVMYLGKVVERGNADTIFTRPMHPYTKALFKSIPDIDTRSVDDLAAIEGNVPSAINPPEGCRFHTRCPDCMDICRVEEPETRFIEDRFAACHLYETARSVQ